MRTSQALKALSAISLVAAMWAAAAPTHAVTPSGSPHLIYSGEALATCAGEPVVQESGPPFIPIGGGDLMPSASHGEAVSAILTFAIGPDGRPRDIRSPEDGRQLKQAADDRNQATLAAWGFPRSTRSDCRLAITYHPVRVETASLEALAAYFGANRQTGPLRDAVERELAGAAASCERPPRPLSYSVPDFNAPGKRPGLQDWSVVRWSVDSEGRPHEVQILASSGAAAFDEQVREAARRVRRAPDQPVRGCVYNWYRRGATVPAPPMPPPPADPDQVCPASIIASWRPRVSPGPEAFLERGIEGWALVRFDIAPWGEVGKVELVEAQPAGAFGEAAVDMVRRSWAGRGEGAVGCLQPVEFRISG